MPDEELPPNQDPDEPAPPSSDPPSEGGQPSEDDIKDPFENETIKALIAGDTILAVTLDGPKVGNHTIDVFTFGEFLAQLDRVVRGLTATLQGIHLSATGRIPRPPEAAPWRMGRLAYLHSASVEFVLGEPEGLAIADDGEDLTSPTIKAVDVLSELVRLGPDDAVGRVREFDDRVGTDFSQLLALLSDNAVESIWRAVHDHAPAALSSQQAGRVTRALRTELPPVESIAPATGFLYQLDAKQNVFKLDPDEGGTITGHYDDQLIGQLRDSWGRRVVAELTRIEHRYAYAADPFEVEHSMRRIVRTLEGLDEPAGGEPAVSDQQSD